mmetsp:Transcript_38600/g.106291  ORF Transcript_38600/g.106291 Transcript_38600/m.106291 type:complete len:119 (+) Transcript_38600:184-540(+)
MAPGTGGIFSGLLAQCHESLSSDTDHAGGGAGQHLHHGSTSFGIFFPDVDATHDAHTFLPSISPHKLAKSDPLSCGHQHGRDVDVFAPGPCPQRKSKAEATAFSSDEKKGEGKEKEEK